MEGMESGSPEVNTVRLGPNTASGDQQRPHDVREYSNKVFYSRFRQGVGRIRRASIQETGYPIAG